VKGTFCHRVVLPFLPAAGSAEAKSAVKVDDGSRGGPAAFAILSAMLVVARANPPKLPSVPQAASSEEAESRRIAQHSAHSVSALLSASGMLKQDSTDGLNLLLGALQEVRGCSAKCKQPLPDVQEILATGQNAIRNFCERPARQDLARAWLTRHGLQHCARLLAAQGLLERLPEVAASVELAEKIGLPQRCYKALATLAAGASIEDAHLAPRGLPAGWRRAFSRSVAMEYFVEVGGAKRTQWPWPVAAGAAERQLPLREPGEPRRPKVGAPLDGFAPYVELDLGCEPFCVLCGVAGTSHLGFDSHLKSKGEWLTRLGRLEALLPEIRRVSISVLAEEAPVRLGFMEVWQGELQFVVRPPASSRADAGAPGSQEDSVARALWHGVVRPRLPTSGEPVAWLAALPFSIEAILGVGRASEPKEEMLS